MSAPAFNEGPDIVRPFSAFGHRLKGRHHCHGRRTKSTNADRLRRETDGPLETRSDHSTAATATIGESDKVNRTVPVRFTVEGAKLNSTLPVEGMTDVVKLVPRIWPSST